MLVAILRSWHKLIVLPSLDRDILSSAHIILNIVGHFYICIVFLWLLLFIPTLVASVLDFAGTNFIIVES